jgi:AraC family transcriptional regulator, melibiose operon regulatory protein
MLDTPTPHSFDPARRDFSPYGLSCVYWQPSLMSRPDHHNEIELNYLPEGSVTYLFGGKKVTLEAGVINLFWAAIPHQIIDFSSPKPYFVATVPLHSFLHWQLPEHFVQALMQGKVLANNNKTRKESDQGLFTQWAQDLTENKVGIEKAVSLELQGRITRMALHFSNEKNSNSTTKHLSGISDSGLSKAEQMACYIAQNYVHKLSIDKIAHEVKLHSSYAMNLFQKTFGTTLIIFLTQHRIAHAQRLLTTTDNVITDIALQSGFSSISRFNEAFQRHCHCSPREYRNAHGR